MNHEDIRVAFDFDVADVTRSPCRGCCMRSDFPRCMDTCRTLDHFQRILATMVSCVRENSPEEYRVCNPTS